MKKRAVFAILIISIFLIFNCASFVIAQNETTDKIDKAYDWLQDEVNEKTCDGLTTEEKIFVLMAIDECESELKDAQDANHCWPSENCNLKTTAQAILALEESNSNTDDAKEWLSSQNTTTGNMIVWYLEIDSDVATQCDITYVNAQSIHTINIGDDKKIDSDAGNCLSLAQYDYWLEVSSSCYDETFDISCDEAFLTTLLFTKSGETTIHVSEKTQTAAAKASTSQKVDSSCFKEQGNCNYEGSLWATVVLDRYSDEEDMSPYLPYLIIMSDEAKYESYFPDVFLHILTNDYQNDIMEKQKIVNNEKYYWKEGANMFYDTALALLPFQYETLPEKTNTINWLKESQADDGYWSQGNIIDNAFLLYSIWPEKSGPRRGDGGEEDISCEDMGYSCMSSMSCYDVGGNELTYYCDSGLDICCDTALAEESCADLNGIICESNENCVDGVIVDAADLLYGETCCVGGTCEEYGTEEITECGEYFGICRAYGCEENEEEAPYDCDYDDVCCVSKTPRRSYWWIWVLLILIVLAVLGIIFKDKLRDFFSKIKSKFGKGRFKPGPRGPPRPGPGVMQPTSRLPRRPMPSPQRQITRPPARGVRSDVGDVLKKLREMGK